MPSACAECGEPLETPLVCAACGSLFEAPEAGPFELLGLPPAFDVDTEELRKRLLRFSRLVHPDFFGSASPAVRALAEHNTAELNSAHEVLADDFRRAVRVLADLGGPDEKAERQMPQVFLMEVLEWNEALEDARAAEPGAPPRVALDALRHELGERRTQLMRDVGALLRELLAAPDQGASAARLARLTDVRRLLNAVRYVDRTLSEMEALRLEQASSR